MKRFKMLWTAGAVVLLGFLGLGFISKTAFAAIPQLINTQGVLRDGSGNPVPDASYSTTFRIYDAASGGSILWSETQSVATLGGQFNVNLGSITPIPNSIFGGSNRWLGVQVSPDPEMTPRQRLVSVGYAYRVNSVDEALGGAINGGLKVAGGNIDMDNAGSTSGHILKAGVPFLHTSDFNNNFLGYDAGNLTSSGSNSNNTGIGYRALRNITTGGNSNTAGGTFALTSSTSGLRNTAFGASALFNNTTGDDNTAVGASALLNNTADSNTAVGAYALFFNTSGKRNTASGFEALRSSTTGSWNTANGVEALRNNTSGNYNTAIGIEALRDNTTGSANVAIGGVALQFNTSGVYNTAVGFWALTSNSSGHNNTACGRQALYSNVSGQANTAIGQATLQTSSSDSFNTAIGAGALLYNLGGSQNTACGVSTLNGNWTGSFNTALGYRADVSTTNLTNATVIGNGAVVNASNKIRLGNTAVTVIEGQVAFTFPSDKNQKENFRPVDGEEVLRKIRDFELTSWNFIGHDPKQFRHYGPMAQDFFAAFGDDGVGKIGTETTINSGDMAGILMIAVQALGNENADLKSRIEYLEEKLKDLQAEKPKAEIR